MISAKALTDSLGNMKESIDKNKKILRLLAYAIEKLEHYTRRDNLRLFNFSACEDRELLTKFIEMASMFGVDIKEFDINIIHHLPSRTPLKHVIVLFNNRHLRNRILYDKTYDSHISNICSEINRTLEFFRRTLLSCP